MNTRFQEAEEASVAPGIGRGDKARVRRRQVFFIPGYDPIAPRRYRELYRREARRQAAISGYEIDIEGQPSGDGPYSWSTWARIDGQETRATITFLTWEDIVRGSMNRSILSAFWVMIRTVWIYCVSGAFFRLMRLRPQPMIAALYPVVVLLAQLEIALLTMAFLLWVVAGLVGLPIWLGGILGAGGAVAAMIAMYRLDRYIFAYYLINDYGFTAQHWGRWPPALQTRISAFADRLGAAMETNVDEVLVIGHSSGAHLAVSALAEALRGRDGRAGPAVSLLTLGQVIPMMSFLPKARELRRDLNDLAQRRDLAWVDVSAPGDGGCFALSDPVHVTGVAPPPDRKTGPKVLSAAFSLSMSPELYAKTKYRFFRRHVQYLCAFDRPRDYDYFQITGGPMTLEARYGARGATASRIETPLSAYRDLA